MQVALPELDSPATLILNSERPLTDDEYWDFCQANPDLRIERSAQGEIILVPPAGWESDYREADVVAQLGNWAKRDQGGKAFGSTAQYFLPNGAGRSPDAAWVSNGKIAGLSKAERKKFVRVVPEFVIEVMSPSDRLKAAKEKMQEWISNGVELGWLIDGDAKTVHVYRRGKPPEEHHGLKRIEGEGPVEGFVLELDAIWEGL